MLYQIRKLLLLHSKTRITTLNFHTFVFEMTHMRACSHIHTLRLSNFVCYFCKSEYMRGLSAQDKCKVL